MLRFAALCAVIVLVAGCADAAPTPSALARTTAHPVPPTPGLPSEGPTQPALTPAATPVKAHWRKAGRMHLARAETHALLLRDGQVLVVGNDPLGAHDRLGRGGSDFAPDDSTIVELWDPATRRWRDTDPLGKPRAGFAAVTLHDGRVLVAGGLNAEGASYSSAYVFDPRSERWLRVGRMDTARKWPAAAVLEDGRVLVAGGRYATGDGAYGMTPDAALAAFHPGGDGSSDYPDPADIDPGPSGRLLATAELFDPATGTWFRTGSLRHARAGADAVTLGDGRVLVWGGEIDDGLDGRTGPAEIYDPRIGRFTNAAPLPTVERDSIRRLGAPVPEGRPQSGDRALGLVALANGDALLAGSEWWWGPLTGDVNLRFDASANDWRQVGDPCFYDEEGARASGVLPPDGFSVTMADGRVMFAGGVARGRAAKVLDPGTGRWASMPQMPAARSHASAVVLNDGTVLVVGGGSSAVAIRFVPDTR